MNMITDERDNSTMSPTSKVGNTGKKKLFRPCIRHKMLDIVKNGRVVNQLKACIENQLPKAVFLYCHPDCPDGLANLKSIGKAKKAL